MFLLLSGASGVGKSTVRALLAGALEPEVRCAEFAGLVAIPPFPDIAWRQRATEEIVRIALAEQSRGRDFLLAGDPVPPGELLAAPSADRLDGVAACLLDCEPDAQRSRLTGRGDHPASFDAHVGFATWMRGHVRDPQRRPEVITASGWAEMRWDRWSSWSAEDPRWRFQEIDTTNLTPQAAASSALDWCRTALARTGPLPATR
jgi:energy-coupling factor transporter ATP-binding protein EcfA2